MCSYLPFWTSLPDMELATWIYTLKTKYDINLTFYVKTNLNQQNMAAVSNDSIIFSCIWTFGLNLVNCSIILLIQSEYRKIQKLRNWTLLPQCRLFFPTLWQIQVSNTFWTDSKIKLVLTTSKNLYEKAQEEKLIHFSTV